MSSRGYSIIPSTIHVPIMLPPNEPFPLTLNSDFEPYLKSYPMAGITPDIKATSRHIVEGAEDLTRVLKRTKRWLNSHAYDEGKRPIYKASSIVESRLTSAQDVMDKHMSSCGSFATLGTAILRAAGVPIRLIDGSHSKSTDHAWIEVYYPIEGTWIPFDFTGYGDLETGFSKDDHHKHKDVADWSEMEDELRQRHRVWLNRKQSRLHSL